MVAIAFVGLGRMGRGMAGRLVAAGHDVVVTSRSPDRATALIEAGARWAATPAEAAEGVSAVFVMVSDDEASRSVWQGSDGVLAGRPAGQALAIECSTLSHDWVLELAETVQDRGMRYLDAPVTGLPSAADMGELTLLLGGEDEVVEAAEPLLAAMSTARLHFGPVGAGTAYKLIVNLMGAVQIAGVAEGLTMAERAGLHLDQVVAALAVGQAASPQVVRTSRQMVAGSHAREVVFAGRLRRKDADYGVRLADALGVGAPLGRVALAGLDALVAMDLGDENESAVIEVARGQRS